MVKLFFLSLLQSFIVVEPADGDGDIFMRLWKTAFKV